jgi:hypothetical protein
LIIGIGEVGELIVNAIHCICIAVLARGPVVCLPVRIEHSEVSIKTTVLLQHENYVINGLETSGLVHQSHAAAHD